MDTTRPFALSHLFYPDGSPMPILKAFCFVDLPISTECLVLNTTA
ncbi:hypothetical protein SAMN04490220_0796 [Rhodococcus jostii]|uniref:Uncharacterized protein n=1 Tax=Rhodococcus jostii TaxID=132919 RepID=A0A1H4JBX5_RHOJO|nr:hypothetical protein SAMN04490220_0796 [Rhodococcus jostii]